MTENKQYLRDLEYFFTTEDGLERRKAPGRNNNNYMRIMSALEAARRDGKLKRRYAENIERARKIAENMPIVHNTGLDSLISILKTGSILSDNNMDDSDISYSPRIYLNRSCQFLQKYVFAYPGNGDWINGLYRLQLSDRLELEPGACFLPVGYDSSPDTDIKDQVMNIGHWRAYFAEYMAVNTEDIEGYLGLSPVNRFPELLFPYNIPIQYISQITCASKKNYDALIERINEEFGANSPILDGAIRITWFGKEMV